MSARLGPARLRWLLAGLVCTLAAAAVAPTAGAHATLERSDPADGAVLEQSPGSVRLWFDEQIVPRFSGAVLRDGDGNAVASVRVRADAGADRLTLALSDELPRGIYTVDWKVLSAEDGHFRGGLLVFGVGSGLGPVGAGQRSADEVSVLDVVLRWLSVSALAGLVGGVAVAGLVLTPSLGAHAALVRSARRRVLGWTLACAALGVAAGAGLLLRQAATLADGLGAGESLLAVSADFLGGTRLGALWIARETLLLVLCVLLLLLWRGRGGRLGLAAAGLLALGLAAVHALGGHAASVSPQTALVVGVAAVHGVAAGLWVGGLAAVTLAVWPFGRGKGERAMLTPASLRRFGVLAAVGVGILGVTGLYYAGRQVASLDALLTTLYGQTLLAKTGLVLLAGLLGLGNALLLRPPGWVPFRPVRSRPLLVGEATAGLAILVAVGLLTASAPARGPEFAPAASASSVPGSLSTNADDLLVTLTAKPNRAGHNVFQAIVASARKPAPAEITGVALRFSRGGKTVAAPMTESESGRYRVAGGYLSEPGRWQVQVLVTRAGLPDAAAPFGWKTAPAAQRAVLVSDRPLGGVLTVLALVLLVLLVSVAALLLPRPVRRRPRRPAAQPLESG